MRTRYRFRHEWHVAATTDAVRELLQDVQGYGAWWPNVRVLADTSTERRRGAELEVRAPIGYRTRISLTESVTNRDELRALVGGDLAGWCAWRILGARGGTRVALEQDVDVRAPLLRLASPLLHHRLAGQHSAVMRAAEQGMRRALGDG